MIVVCMLRCLPLTTLSTAACELIRNGIVFSKTNKRHNKNRALYDLKKYTIWCVRNIGDRKLKDSGKKMNTESAPCHICVKRLLKFGFQKMGYTDQDGNMVIIKLDKFSGYASSSQLKMAPKITI